MNLKTMLLYFTLLANTKSEDIDIIYNTYRQLNTSSCNNNLCQYIDNSDNKICGTFSGDIFDSKLNNIFNTDSSFYKIEKICIDEFYNFGIFNETMNRCFIKCI